MAKKTTKKPKKQVETLTHTGASRTNIPTAEFEAVMGKEQRQAKKVDYSRPGGAANGAMQDEINGRNVDLDPQLVWRGKDTQNWSDLIAAAPPLFIQEKVHPKVLIDDLRRQTEANEIAQKLKKGAPPLSEQADLFADFNGLPDDPQIRTEFYQHDAHWTNRMILGDSLSVMSSLAEREGLRGKVQCIYLDPPYGIKFNSNFQWSTTSRDVKDGKADHITREPEQVKAFRDTWRDGIHSYLTYLRDRLTVARDLLTESGSIFVQIGDENVHRVRALMDEVFGEENFVSKISYTSTSGIPGNTLARAGDYILWYSKNIDKIKYRQLFSFKNANDNSHYNLVFSNGKITRTINDNNELADNEVLATSQSLTSQGQTKTDSNISLEGKAFNPPSNQHWKTTVPGIHRLYKDSRVILQGNSLRYVRLVDDFPIVPINNMWASGTVIGSQEKIYVVQTSMEAIQRCILMATDPGDLVLDPTCGSGTTAYVAEQWGRRWITIDTSRVSLALARARIMGARYPYYLLADSPEGKEKEAKLVGLRQSPPSAEGGNKEDSKEDGRDARPTDARPTTNLRQGFVYERVPHITLKAIANNAEIDVIWEQYEKTLAPLREKITEALPAGWLSEYRKQQNYSAEVPEEIQEWEVPRDISSVIPDSSNIPATSPVIPAKAGIQPEQSQKLEQLLDQFWQQRIARQKKIDSSISAKANYEYLYDKPYEDKKKVRVAGPFTVESLSPHRALDVDENDNIIDPLEKMASHSDTSASASEVDPFYNMVIENLKTAGVQQAHKQDKITFTSIKPHPGEYICAEGRYTQTPDDSAVGRASRPSSAEGGNREDIDGGRDARPTAEHRAGIFIGPEFGTISRQDLVVAAREASDMGFDCLISCGFNYEAHASELSKLGALPILKARMNADLHMADDLKNTGKGNLFVIFGEPDIQLLPPEDAPQPANGEQANLSEYETLRVRINGVDVFHPSTGKVQSDDTNGIACWFIDTDYNEESFFVRQAYFLGASDPYKKLKTTLKAEIDKDAWNTLHSAVSREFKKPESGRIAVKVINHLGDEVMKVYKVE